jgi:hypothetical protein
MTGQNKCRQCHGIVKIEDFAAPMLDGARVLLHRACIQPYRDAVEDWWATQPKRYGWPDQ